VLTDVKQALDNVIAWEWLPASDCIRASTTVRSVYGVDRIARIDDLLQLVLPRDRARHRMAVERALEGCKPYASHFRLVRPDLRVVHVREHAHVLCDGRGFAAIVIGVSLIVPATTSKVWLEVEQVAHALLAREASNRRARGITKAQGFAQWDRVGRGRIRRAAHQAISKSPGS